MADVKLVSMALTDQPGQTGGDTRDAIEQVLASYPDYNLFNTHASLSQSVWSLLFILVRKEAPRGRPPKEDVA
jgi:hypothetical protein